MAAITLLGFTAAGAAEKRGKRDERRNMELVGQDDLQARSAYQPIVHRQGDRWIAYVGHHGGEALNKLTGADRANTGLHILKLTGDALAIVSGKKETTTDAASPPSPRRDPGTRLTGWAQEAGPASAPPPPPAHGGKAPDCD
ncbi:MAG TPA: hypothetical protein VLT61_13690 [Anaeromyxobacteraceae bacterium]|nr:hypothetical protein [Anaeromyxobacteraceae bacterium]